MHCAFCWKGSGLNTGTAHIHPFCLLFLSLLPSMRVRSRREQQAHKQPVHTNYTHACPLSHVWEDVQPSATGSPTSNIPLQCREGRKVAMCVRGKVRHCCCREVRSVFWGSYRSTHRRSVSQYTHCRAGYCSGNAHGVIVIGSNLGWDTGYPDWGSSWVSSAPLGKLLDTTSI
jgi:hypothetical protein